MKKKIGFFLGVTPSMGGVFQYTQCLLEAAASLPQNKFDVVIAYTDHIWEDYLYSHSLKTFFIPNALWTYGLGTLVTILGLPIPLWRRLSPFFDSAARSIMNEKCDLWIVSSYSFVCYQMPVPTVGIIHDLMHHYERQFPEVGSFITYLWREKTFSRICRWTKGILVDSETGKNQVVESYEVDQNRIHVLPYIAPKYIHSSKQSISLDKRYKIPQKFLFYPAQFWAHKNHKRLIKAVARVKMYFSDIHLVLVGSKKHQEYLVVQSLVEELDVSENVTFLGYVAQEDIVALYHKARALIMPTFFGPTNIPPLEAFAAGCPVAISGIYGMPEQIGNAGLLFDPHCVDEIADTIITLWKNDDLCAKLVKKGKERVHRWGQAQFNERLKDIVLRILEYNYN